MITLAQLVIGALVVFLVAWLLLTLAGMVIRPADPVDVDAQLLDEVDEILAAADRQLSESYAHRLPEDVEQWLRTQRPPQQRQGDDA